MLRLPAIDKQSRLRAPDIVRDSAEFEYLSVSAAAIGTFPAQMSPEQLLAVLSDCGILSDDAVSATLSRWRQGPPESAADAAVELVRAGRLTPFQARASLYGFAHRLVLGNYVLTDEVGAGGMGRVYRAVHRRMDRVVALKLLSEGSARTPQALERFRREIRAAARLDHPNIVTAHDADEWGDTHFLVMQYVAGVDLARLVARRGSLAVESAVELMAQAADGLAYAHSQGVTHRDVKPSNLLLGTDGRLRILDLGIARIDGLPRWDESTVSAVTRTGQIMGTVDYMAPEQAIDSHRVDGRADVYSLGCTLFYLLTGEPPFRGDSALERLLAHREQTAPSLAEHCPVAPVALNALFACMLRKRPDERPSPMDHVAAELRGLLASDPESVARRQTALAGIIDSEKPAVTFTIEDLRTPPDHLGALPQTVIPSAAATTLVPHSAGTRVAAPTRPSRLLPAAIVLLGLTASLAGGLWWFRGGDTRPLSDPPATDAAPFNARELAKWILNDSTGELVIRQGDAEWSPILEDDLPSEPFDVVAVSLFYSDAITDSTLQRFEGCTTLRKLDLSGIGIGDAGMVRIRTLTGLEELTLDSPRITNNGAQLLSKLPRLRTLRLSMTSIDDQGAAALEGLTELETLDLSQMKVGDAAVARLAALKKLKHLDLSYNGGVTDRSVATLGALSQLESLKIEDTGITSAGEAALREKLPGCDIVWKASFEVQQAEQSKLRLDGPDLDRPAAVWALGIGGRVEVRVPPSEEDLDVSEIAKLPGERFIVHGLDLSNDVTVTDESLKAIENLPYLAFLNLDGTGVTDAGMPVIGSLRELFAIHLSSTAVSDAGLEPLSRCPSLTIAYLKGTKVRGAGLVHLPFAKIVDLEHSLLDDEGAASLAGLSKLETLSVSSTALTEVGFAPLSRLPSLKSLTLYGIRVNDAALRHIAAIPNLDSLALSSAEVTNAGFESLAGAERMKSLRAMRTRLDDDGVEHILRFRRLELLSISYSAVTDAGALKLRALRSLTSLDLEGTQVSDAAIDTLRKALPACKVSGPKSSTRPVR